MVTARVMLVVTVAQAGGVDLLKAKWKKLSDYITIECDGQDITHKLKEHKVHASHLLPLASRSTRSSS